MQPKIRTILTITAFMFILNLDAQIINQHNPDKYIFTIDLDKITDAYSSLQESSDIHQKEARQDCKLPLKDSWLSQLHSDIPGLTPYSSTIRSEYHCTQKSNTYGLSLEGYIQYFLPPYPIRPILLDESIDECNCDLNKNIIIREAWAPIGKVFSGRKIYLEWLQATKKYETFGKCNRDDICNVLLSGKTANDDLSVIAWCAARHFDGMLGSPYNCSPIAVTKNSKTWMLVMESINDTWCGGNCREMSEYEFSLGRSNAIPVIRALDVLTHMETVLREQWSFTTKFIHSRNGKSGSLHATAFRRPSRILENGYNESVTISIDSYENGKKSADDFCMEEESYECDTRNKFYVVLNLWVSRQNSSSEADWHPPTDQQSELYIRKLAEILRSSTNDICTKKGGTLSIKDSSTYECRQPNRPAVIPSQ